MLSPLDGFLKGFMSAADYKQTLDIRISGDGLGLMNVSTPYGTINLEPPCANCGARRRQNAVFCAKCGVLQIERRQFPRGKAKCPWWMPHKWSRWQWGGGDYKMCKRCGAAFNEPYLLQWTRVSQEFLRGKMKG